jgi:hypothetical protein
MARIVRPLSLFLAASTVALAPSPARADPSSTTTEQGYELGEIQHPRTLAMASAQQAFGGSTTAVYANPANLPLYRVYHLEGIATFSPEARRQSYGGAVVDSSTSRLAGGFGGTWSRMDSDGIRRQWTDLRLALAYPISDRFHVGIAGRYLRANQGTARGPFGPSLASDGTPQEPIVNEFTFDAGLAVSITESLRIGVSGRNLTAPGTGLMPTALAGGLGYASQNFSIEADTLVDFTTYGSARMRTMVGGELLVADHFPVRAGYRFDGGMKTHAVGAGIGYVDRRFGLEVGARRDVAADHPATMVGLAIRIFIDASGGDSQTDSL